MNPERLIVNIWLNKQGFFTVNGLNAGSRVVDVIAVRQRQKEGPEVRHIEVYCSVSSNMMSAKERQELSNKFTDSNVVRRITRYIKTHIGGDAGYTRAVVTTALNADIQGIEVINFGDVFFDVINDLDRQNYGNSVIRALQLSKYLLLSSPGNIAVLLGKKEPLKPMTQMAREKFIKSLLEQDAYRALLRKKESEGLLIQLLQESTLKSPERLASALQRILTKRTSSRFFNVLLRQKEIKEAAREEISREVPLKSFFQQND